jgi:Nucleotidyl transferase AbiEii toxin, Type IV TA system
MGALEFFRLDHAEKETIFNDLAQALKLPPSSIEKDWWVVETLRLIYQLDVAPNLLFKGGTSLSKAWGLIERFSEDIDLALDREYLGFQGDISRTQVGKLRDASFAYISKTLYPSLQEKFRKAGISDVEIRLGEVKSTDQDPLTIEIHYPSVTERSEYVLPKILVEIGSRALREPLTTRRFCSLVGEHYADRAFADAPIEVPCVNPERTFLEKLFLLHEGFQRPVEKRRVERLSRHLYDIEKISRTKYADIAKSDKALYSAIVAHRERFSKLGGVDYASHFPPNLNPIPPADLRDAWEKDYQTMQEQMIYGDSLPFDGLLSAVGKITDEINQLEF